MATSSNSEQRSRRDLLIWILVIILIAGGIVAYYYFQQVALAIRVAASLVAACIIIILALQTSQGRRAYEFAKEARMELRKVVWPTRQETIQTTMVVVAMVIIMALFLWGIDSVLMWAVSWFSGQRG